MEPRQTNFAPAYHPLVVVLAAASSGIVADRWLGSAFGASGFAFGARGSALGASGAALGAWVALAVASWLLWRLLWRRRNDRWSLLPLLVATAAVAGAWHHCRWSLFDVDDISRFAGRESRPVALAARVSRGARLMPAPPPDPLRTMPVGNRTRVEVEILAVRNGRQWREASGLATVVVMGLTAAPRAGDRLTLFAQMRAAHPPDNPGEFDFAAYGRTQRHGATLIAEHPDCLAIAEPRSRQWSLQGTLDRWRSGNRELLARYLSPRRAGLAAAMFLGVREDLQPEDNRAFFETGTVHLLVVSGLNVGILVATLMLLARLPLVNRGMMLAVAAVFCVLYALVTDSQPPVVRATVMVLVGCGALWLGRPALSFNSLAVAALVVLAINPADLFGVGPQLSFLAVAALTWRKRAPSPPPDPLQRLIERSRPWPGRALNLVTRHARLALAESAVMCCAVAPLVLARFHLLSASAVLLGPLLALPVAVGMASGFVLLATGAWLPPVAMLSAVACDGCLWFVERGVEWGQRVPGGHLWLPGPSGWWLAGFYAGLAAWAILRLRSPSRWPVRWAVALFCAWLSIGLGAGWVERHWQPRLLRCTNLAVGHGTAVVLELPDGRALLYDAGRLGSPQGASDAVAGYLWSRGITHLDAVVLSHADADHYNALPALTREFSIGVVYVSPLMFDNMNGGLEALRRSLDQAGVRVAEVWAPARLEAGPDCDIEIIHPPRRGMLASDNANSIVLAVEHAGRRLLLTGDLESPGIEAVLAEEPWDCDVLVAPHHGSMYSAPEKVAAWCRPEWTIISGSDRDQHAAVDAAYGAHGQVWHTSREGAVQVTLGRDGILVRSWRRLTAARQSAF